MTIVNIEKSPTWTDMLTGLAVGEDLNAPYDKMRSITSLISGTLKYKYTSMAFATSKATIKVKGQEIQVLNIKRIA